MSGIAAARGVGKSGLAPHASWCPVGAYLGTRSSGAYGKVRDFGRCLCKNDTLELSDPRPELVAEATARYRAKHRQRYA